MWKIAGISLWWVSLTVAAMIVDTVLGSFPLWLLVLVAIVLASAALPLMYWPALTGRYRSPYIPIRDAIRHIIHTAPHSYQDAQLAADHYFEVLHEHICSGRIKAIGRKDEDARLQRISKRECKNLTPMEIVEPRSPHAPEGVSYCLVARTEPSTFSPLDDAPFDGFTGIRVRSRELYQWWPKTKGENDDA